MRSPHSHFNIRVVRPYVGRVFCGLPRIERRSGIVSAATTIPPLGFGRPRKASREGYRHHTSGGEALYATPTRKLKRPHRKSRHAHVAQSSWSVSPRT